MEGSIVPVDEVVVAHEVGSGAVVNILTTARGLPFLKVRRFLLDHIEGVAGETPTMMAAIDSTKTQRPTLMDKNLHHLLQM